MASPFPPGGQGCEQAFALGLEWMMGPGLPSSAVQGPGVCIGEAAPEHQEPPAAGQPPSA